MDGYYGWRRITWLDLSDNGLRMANTRQILGVVVVSDKWLLEDSESDNQRRVTPFSGKTSFEDSFVGVKIK